MRKFFVLSLLVCGFGLAVTNAKAQNPLGEILRRMDVNNKSLQSLRADVTMVKTDSVLNVSDTSVGSTSYLPKTPNRVMYVRIDWTKPLEEMISVIGDNYELYRPRLAQVIQGKTNNAKNNASVGGALGFMSMSKEQLKTNYTVIYIGEEQIKGGTLTWHLQLNPKTATSYKMAELWVDGDGMPRQAKIVEQNNDSTTVFLSNIQKNVTLKGEIFKLNYDKKKVKFIRA
ncbi:MAG: LolA family protein [Pyrinomonadaceae bacterium]